MFSQCCSQLHGMIMCGPSPPLPRPESSWMMCSPGSKVFEDIEARQQRLLRRRPHVGEHQTVVVHHRVPGLTHAIAMQPHLRLAGLLEAVAFHVEQPAVVAAADALLLHLPVIKRGAAMGSSADRRDPDGRACRETG